MTATNANGTTKSAKTSTKATAAQKAGFPATPKPAAKKAAAKPAADKPVKGASPAAKKTATAKPADASQTLSAPRKRSTPKKSALPSPAAETQQPADTTPAADSVTPVNHINAALAEASTLPVDVLSKTAMAFGAAALAQLGSGPTGATRPARAGDATGGRRAGDNTDGTDNQGDASGNTGTTTKGTKVQQERPTQNGVTRQSKGSVGDQLWTAYDNHGGNPTLVEARALAKSLKLNETSASLALYQWRKFHGYGKTPVANPTPDAAPATGTTPAAQ